MCLFGIYDWHANRLRIYNKSAGSESVGNVMKLPVFFRLGNRAGAVFLHFSLYFLFFLFQRFQVLFNFSFIELIVLLLLFLLLLLLLLLFLLLLFRLLLLFALQQCFLQVKAGIFI